MAAFLLGIVTLTYLDRLNISVAAAHIQREFSLTGTEMGAILSAFVFGYAVFQIPGGMLVDLAGPRRVLAASIFLWSLFTVLTAFAGELVLANWFGLLWSFFLLRFLVGVGEAPALPAANKIVSLWMAPKERGLGNGIFIAGLGLGGVGAPPLIVWLMQNWGWRFSFLVTGLVGVPVLLLWMWYASDRPETHRSVNRAEREWIQGGTETARPLVSQRRVPWRLILSHGSAWALAVSYFLCGYTTYIFFTWFFLYLVNVRMLSVSHAGFWSTVPFLAMTLMAPLGGHFSDRAVERWGKRWGRRATAFVGMVGAATMLVVGSTAENVVVAILLMALAAGFVSFSLATWWATTVDISRHFAGSVSGFMNTAGNLGGALSPTLTPYLAARYGWPTALGVAAGVAVVAALLWFFIRADEPLQDARDATAS